MPGESNAFTNTHAARRDHCGCAGLSIAVVAWKHSFDQFDGGSDATLIRTKQHTIRKATDHHCHRDAGALDARIAVTILVTIWYNLGVRIISRRILREFWEKHPEATIPLQTWFHDVEHATWNSPADIKAVYRNASIVANNRVVFNIKGNLYRFVIVVVYQHGVVYIRFVGTHAEYGRIDATTI